jgi:cytochrome c-type protein NapB
MKARNQLIAMLLASVAGALLVASCATAPVEKPQALRKIDVSDPDQAPALIEYAGKTPGEQDRIARNFEQQPPLIPHKAEGYRIDAKTNRCLECHDRPFYKEEKAPKIGDSHYKDRDGKELTHVSSARYFCSQCHVPQANAAPLVANTFRSPKAGD